MAQECTLVFEKSLPVSYTCDDGTGIEKGAILKLVDLRTVSPADGDGDPVAGIAAEEKIASDGKVKIAVYETGTFKGTAGATGAAAGQGIMTYASTGDPNDIVVTGAAEDNCMGTASETAANNETFLFELKPSNRDMA